MSNFVYNDVYADGAFAPIKPEYYRNDISNNDTNADVKRDSGDPPPTKKVKRGQNKSRHKKNKMKYDLSFCKNIIKGIECTLDNCKYSHDLNEFINKKESDIDSKCFIYDRFGSCKYGYGCRYYVGHYNDYRSNNEDVRKFYKKNMDKYQENYKLKYGKQDEYLSGMLNELENNGTNDEGKKDKNEDNNDGVMNIYGYKMLSDIKKMLRNKKKCLVLSSNLLDCVFILMV